MQAVPVDCSLNRQLDSVGMLLITLVLFREDLFEPMCLVFRNPFISKCGLMTDNELLAATVAPKRAHFL
jgi:hypothetical protein